jgi:hypothetical protein
MTAALKFANSRLGLHRTLRRGDLGSLAADHVGARQLAFDLVFSGPTATIATAGWPERTRSISAG